MSEPAFAAPANLPEKPAAQLDRAAAPWRQRLKTISRDTRDTWFMLAVIGWTVAPHLLRLPFWVGALSSAVLAWRAWLAWREAPMPGRWSLVAVLILACGLTLLGQRTLLGKEAGVTLLVVLMALKTLELRARRDALVVFFLGFFLVLTQFLYSQSLLTAVSTGVAVWGWLTALTLAHMPAGRPALRGVGGLALRAAAYGTPLMIALFLLFPRVAPLWGVPGDNASTGLSDELRLGDVAELALDESIALRVRFKGSSPPTQTLYFRGPVLSQYDGITWRENPLRKVSHEPPPEVAHKGKPISYEITLEPLRLKWLPTLDYTLEGLEAQPVLEGLVPPQDDGLSWHLVAPLAERVLYRAQAWSVASVNAVPRLPQARQLLDLPPGFHPRTRAWAAALQAQPEMRGAQAQDLARAVLRHIATSEFTYTLKPGGYEADTIDEFWLDRKLGFCEHYASAFVVIMRAMGVPARIVTGYQGSDPEPVDGYYVIRQSHAHAWAEYWQAERGWIRADPTAAVAPERVMQNRQLAGPRGLVMGTLDAVNPGLRLQLRRFVEAIDNRWNQWVLGYGRQQQFRMLDKLGIDAAHGLDLLRWLVLGLSTLGLLGAAWAWWDGRRQTPWQRLQAGILGQLQRLGLPAAPSQSPGAWAELVRGRYGASGEPLAGLLLELQALRYAPGALATVDKRWWRRFKLAASAIRSQTAKVPLEPKVKPR